MGPFYEQVVNPFGLGIIMIRILISGLHRSNVGFNESEVFILIDLALNPASSGSGLVDS